MSKITTVRVIVCLLALCSIVYELLLGQALSAFLGDTVLRYSVTIGLYLLSMGIGAFLAGGRVSRDPIVSLLAIELLLAALGGSALMFLHGIDAYLPSPVLFSPIAHLMIVTIGILTGMELPLLISIRAVIDPGVNPSRAEREVLGYNYFGAFLGTVFFAFVLYPTVGLIPASFIVALVNCVAGLLLWKTRNHVVHRPSLFRRLLTAQTAVLVLFLIAMASATKINEYFIQMYLRG